MLTSLMLSTNQDQHGRVRERGRRSLCEQELGRGLGQEGGGGRKWVEGEYKRQGMFSVKSCTDVAAETIEAVLVST